VTRYLLDTDTFSHYLRSKPNVLHAVARHVTEGLAITVVTREEQWFGWAAVIAKARHPEQVAAAYDRLSDTLNELRDWPVVGFSTAAVHRYAALKKQKLNVGANDLKIAAIAIESGAVVVTHNVRDFRRIPGVTTSEWFEAPNES